LAQNFVLFGGGGAGNRTSFVSACVIVVSVHSFDFD
jgi:hypothetical protein